jgi:hypothetical protein
MCGARWISHRKDLPRSSERRLLAARKLEVVVYESPLTRKK